MNFGQRHGFESSLKKIQIDSIDEELKNGIWNIFSEYFLATLVNRYTNLSDLEEHYSFALWHSFFKKTIDSIPRHNNLIKEEIKKWFFKTDWYKIYNFLEFTCSELNTNKYPLKKEDFENAINKILEREFSGYRFVEGVICPITNNHEINEFLDAFSNTNGFSALKGCNIHLHSALEKLSEKVNPDYRNSIKESISAVESLAKVISGKERDSLGASLDKLRGKISLHPALEKGFKQLYGYTSDEGGIRHAIMDESNCDFEDAKYMLISCSAFINYLISKSHKNKITFS